MPTPIHEGLLYHLIQPTVHATLRLVTQTCGVDIARNKPLLRTPVFAIMLPETLISTNTDPDRIKWVGIFHQYEELGCWRSSLADRQNSHSP